MGVCKVLFVSLKTGVSVPQSYGSLVIKSHWASRSDSLRTPSPFVGSPGWEAWHGVLNLQDSRITSLVLLFSSLWVAHLAGMGFDFIVICPSYHIAVTSSLSFDMEHLFLVGSRVLLLVVVQQLVVILVLSQEDVCVHPSTLPSWTRLVLLIFESWYWNSNWTS